MPLIAGWLSDRIGRKPLIIGVYVGGAVGFLVFLAAGTNLVWLWLGIALMGLFAFAESPQLQALLADIAPPATRDASYALYFTMAFGVGSLWTIVYGLVIGALGEATGVPVVFGLMAVTFILAALGDDPDPRRAASPRERRVRGDAAVAGEVPPADGAGQRSPHGGNPDGWHTAGRGSPDEPARGADVDARILLVEDDPSIREITAIGLRQAGFTVETAADGQAGLGRFAAEPFDLILLDVMLPRLDGLEVCRAIRLTSMVPVVMLTARGDTVDVVVGLEAGADDYVNREPYWRTGCPAPGRASRRGRSRRTSQRARTPSSRGRPVGDVADAVLLHSEGADSWPPIGRGTGRATRRC